MAFRSSSISAMVRKAGHLQQLQFMDGTAHPLNTLFARGEIGQNNFVSHTDCETGTEGMIRGLIAVDEFGRTSIPGIHAAGDNCSLMRALSEAMAA